MDLEADRGAAYNGDAERELQRHRRQAERLRRLPLPFFFYAVVTGLAGSLWIAFGGGVQEVPKLLGAVAASVCAAGVAYVAGKYLEDRSWRESNRVISVAVLQAAEEVEREKDVFFCGLSELVILEGFPQWGWFDIARAFSVSVDSDTGIRGRPEDDEFFRISADRVPDQVFEDLISALASRDHVGLAKFLHEEFEFRKLAVSALKMVDQVELDARVNEYRRRDENISV